VVQALGFSFIKKSKDKRKVTRRKAGTIGWVRLDGGFATRQCNVVDISDDGVQIALEAAQKIPDTFTFLPSRGVGSGRRARVIWRRGSQIGAKFT
jgi:hypothetical protein